MPKSLSPKNATRSANATPQPRLTVAEAKSLRLTRTKLRKQVRDLASRVSPFARIFAQFGYPPMWDRPAEFGTLVHMVLEQQVSLESARASFDKLKLAIPSLSPDDFLRLTDSQLKSFGFSHQKSGYCRGIAEQMHRGQLDLNELGRLPDQQAYDRLVQIRGIGPWTACVYLMMVLLRPDVWPNGDRALAVGAFEVLELPQVPSYPELAEIADQWRPFRSVAARLIWHHYLKIRGK